MDPEVQGTLLPPPSQSCSMRTGQSCLREPGASRGVTQTHTPSPPAGATRWLRCSFDKFPKSAGSANGFYLLLCHTANIAFFRCDLTPSFQKAVSHQPCTDASPGPPSQTLGSLPPQHSLKPAASDNSSRADIMD